MTNEEFTILRERSGITKKEIAQITGLHKETISNFEKGKKVNPSTYEKIQKCVNEMKERIAREEELKIKNIEKTKEKELSRLNPNCRRAILKLRHAFRKNEQITCINGEIQNRLFWIKISTLQGLTYETNWCINEFDKENFETSYRNVIRSFLRWYNNNFFKTHNTKNEED